MSSRCNCCLCRRGLVKVPSMKDPGKLLIAEEHEGDRLNVVGVIWSPNPDVVEVHAVYREMYRQPLEEWAQMLRDSIAEAKAEIDNVIQSMKDVIVIQAERRHANFG